MPSRFHETEDQAVASMALERGYLDDATLGRYRSRQERMAGQGYRQSLLDLIRQDGRLGPRVVKRLRLYGRYCIVRERDKEFGKRLIEASACRSHEVKHVLHLQNSIYNNWHRVISLGELLVRRGYLSRAALRRIEELDPTESPE